MNKPYWYCVMCHGKFKTYSSKCPFCEGDLIGYVDVLGGVHDCGCGIAPDGTDCGECSYGDCSNCPIWKRIVTNKYSASARHNGVYIVGKQKLNTDSCGVANANRIAKAIERTKKYERE